MNEVLVNTLLIVGALFPIVNPLGGAPIFLSLTRDYTSAQRDTLSWRVARNSFFLLIASLLVGTHILSFFGISIPVVQVGGGLVVISTGWKMLNWKSEEDRVEPARRNVSPEDISQRAFYPLTLPLTVGPGSISVAITLGANAPHHGDGNLLLIVAAIAGSILTALSVYLCYASAERMSRVIGAAGMGVILRLSSFLLLCIGVQILWNGASRLLETLPALTR
jgi:multiple antibiotic resistance protein